MISDCALLTTSSSAGIDMMNEVGVAGVVCQVPAPGQIEHMIREASSPDVRYSSNYSLSSVAGVNMTLSTVPSQSASSTAVTRAIDQRLLYYSPVSLLQSLLMNHK